MSPVPTGVRQGGRRKSDHLMRVPKMAEMLASRIRRQIILGQLEEGEVLLSEAALIKESGVSRPSLREAFRILESESFITINRGSRGGARILSPKVEVAARYAGVFLQYAETTLEDVQMVRVLIEPPAVRTLADNRDPIAIKRLRDHIALEAKVNGGTQAFAQLSTLFHELVMELAGNKTLALVAAMLREVVEKHAARSMAPAFDIEQTERAVRSHTRLVDLIEAGEAEEALAHWREHLQYVAQRMLVNAGSQRFVNVLD